MLKTILVLPDGTELSSGKGTTNAIKNITITECVNDAQELSLGSVCANMVQISLITPEGGISVAAGQELTVYRQDLSGVRHLVGIFIAEKPTRTSANAMSVTAYDRITKLDRDLTRWLAELDRWPYSLEELALRVCQQCGLELISSHIPNGSFPVQKFSADGITGRQLMKWIGEIAGRFCRVTPEGKLELAWYLPVTGISYKNGDLNITHPELAVENGQLTSKTISITDDGKGNISLVLPVAVENLYYYQNGLQFEDYAVLPVKKVQLQQSAQDAGIAYPNTAEAVNTYKITGNGLLANANSTLLKTVAQTLYEQLRGVCYTPCRITVPASMQLHAGHILQLTDANGKALTVYVMTKTQQGQRDILECTGSFRRDSAAAVNNRTFEELSGKVLNLRTDVDGIRAENSAANGQIAKLQLDVSGVSAEVSRQQSTMDGLQKAMTSVVQSADALALSVAQIREGGVSQVITKTGYTFGADGLQIAKTGQEMENLLTEKGMYVTRLGEAILQADSKGVVATDVSVRNYLVVGDHTRLEDYANSTDSHRTAVFWIGGMQ